MCFLNVKKKELEGIQVAIIMEQLVNKGLSLLRRGQRSIGHIFLTASG